MSRWWRAYDEAVDDPKLQQLPAELFRAWFNICCVTSQNGGKLPTLDAISFKLRIKPAKANKLLGDLRAAGLIDESEDGSLRPHNWDGRQFKSDATDGTNAERQQRYRDRHRNAVTTVTETVTVTDPETEQITEEERKEEPADAGPPSKYVFESGVIRLSASDFEKWLEAFQRLDLKAELLSLSEWAATQPKWFYAVSSALAKRNRELGLRQIAASKGAPLSPSGQVYPDGVM